MSEKQQKKKKKAAPKSNHCKHPLKGHNNVVDCPRNRKKSNFFVCGFVLEIIYMDDCFSGIFMSDNVQVSINFS